MFIWILGIIVGLHVVYNQPIAVWTGNDLCQHWTVLQFTFETVLPCLNKYFVKLLFSIVRILVQ